MASLSCDRAAAFANATARQGMPVGPTAIVGDGPPPGRLRREGASAPKMAVLQRASNSSTVGLKMRQPGPRMNPSHCNL